MIKIKLSILCAFFSFPIITKAAPPEIILVRTNTDSVGLYDKFEISLNIKAEFINPFNPGEIHIAATFISPAGKQWNINGFYNYASGTVWKSKVFT